MSEKKEIFTRLGQFAAKLATHEEANMLQHMVDGVAYMIQVGSALAKTPALGTKMSDGKPKWQGCDCKKYKDCVIAKDNARRAVGYLVALASNKETGPAAERYIGHVLDWVQGAPATSPVFAKVRELKTGEGRQTVLYFADLVVSEEFKIVGFYWEQERDCPRNTCYLFALLMVESFQPHLVKFIDNYLLAKP